MAKDITFKQVKLQRTPEVGSYLVTTTSYIPSEFAIVGKFVDLEESNNWITWQVVEVSQKEYTSEMAKNISDKYHKLANNDLSLRHRK